MRRINKPVKFQEFKQRVRRHRQREVLEAVSSLAARYASANINGTQPPALPNVVQLYSLAGVARAAILYGNNHRSTDLEETDIIEMCALYAHVEEPALNDDPSSERLLGLLHRLAYEQFGQVPQREDIGRALLLFTDHADASKNAPKPDDWLEILGTSLRAFMATGFVMHGLAIHSAGRIAIESLDEPNIADHFGSLSVDDARVVIDNWYSATLEDMKQTGQEAEAAGLEKWSLNPLRVRPLMQTGNRYLVPCPQWLIERFTPTGLYFIGLEAWGNKFTDALGSMFEAYVGSQLALLRHSQVHEEITYGTHGEKTVDFFVVTSEAVVLVEVKSARPVYSTRLGQAESDEDIDKKIGKAIKQINNSAELIRNEHRELDTLKATGLPLVGVVVTLEPFHLVNTFAHEILSKATIPTVVVSSLELEGFIAATFDRDDVGARFLDSVEQPDGRPPSLSASVSDLQARPNPLLDEAWGRLFQPLEDASEHHEGQPQQD